MADGAQQINAWPGFFDLIDVAKTLVLIKSSRRVPRFAVSLPKLGAAMMSAVGIAIVTFPQQDIRVVVWVNLFLYFIVNNKGLCPGKVATPRPDNPVGQFDSLCRPQRHEHQKDCKHVFHFFNRHLYVMHRLPPIYMLQSS